MPTINFSGLASGIDSTALIQALSDATRKQRVTPNQNKIKELQDTNDSLSDLKTKLTDLQSKLKVFTTLNGGGLAKQATSSNETVATATAANGASNGTYALTVTQKAQNATFSWNYAFTSASDLVVPAGTNGSVTVLVGTGSNQESVTVNVTQGSTTITEFVNSFNSSSTKAQASLVNVGTTASPSYRVVITTNKEGTLDGQISVTSDSNVDAGGRFTNAGQTVSQAVNATLSVSGISGTITRNTNSINDIITGVTFSIEGTGTANVTIGDDVSTTQASLQEYIDAYNDLVSFIKENNTIEREQDNKGEVTNIFASLSNTRVDDNALQSLRDKVASTGYSSGTFVKIFADLGITTERDGTLKFDTTKFADAMSKEPNSVNEVLTSFADNVATTGGTIDLIIRFNGLLDTTTNANTTQINDLNKRISEAEANILKQEDELRIRFARLESQVSRLQAQQQRLTSALQGLG